MKAAGPGRAAQLDGPSALELLVKLACQILEPYLSTKHLDARAARCLAALLAVRDAEHRLSTFRYSPSSAVTNSRSVGATRGMNGATPRAPSLKAVAAARDVATSWMPVIDGTRRRGTRFHLARHQLGGGWSTSKPTRPRTGGVEERALADGGPRVAVTLRTVLHASLAARSPESDARCLAASPAGCGAAGCSAACDVQLVERAYSHQCPTKDSICSRHRAARRAVAHV